MRSRWGTLGRPLISLAAVGAGTLLATWLTLTVDSIVVLDASVTDAADYAWHQTWPWVLRATLWCVVLWIATVEQARRGRTWLPLTVTAAVVIAWTALGSFGIWSMGYDGEGRTPALVDRIGWVVGWPGPDESNWLSWCVEQGCTKQVRLTIVTPILLAAALAVTAVLAARSVTARVPTSSTRTSRAVASVILGGSAIGCLAAAAWLGIPDWWGGDPTIGDITVELVDSMWPVLLAAAVGLLVTGAGWPGWITFGFTLAGWTWTWFDSWWNAQESGMLARAALGTAAALATALVVPTSRAIGGLDREAPAVPAAPAAVH